MKQPLRRHVAASALPLLAAALFTACGGPQVIRVEPSTATSALQTATAAPPTATAAPPTTTVAPPTATVPPPTATPAPVTATVAPSTATPVPPTVTPMPPTATVPEPTATPDREALVYVFPVQSERCWYPSSHHTYPAVDIFCPIGTPFVAVTSGVVEFVSREDVWNRATNRPEDRSGLAVAIIGDDGVRYYGSHLSEVAEGIVSGVRVEAGQLLGRTGDTGNAKGTDPHLHFGISHPTTPDDWAVRRGQVWPQPYLAAWKRGESVTPQLP